MDKIIIKYFVIRPKQLGYIIIVAIYIISLEVNYV